MSLWTWRLHGDGYRIEPGSFAVRLAAARPGDVVPVDLTVRARSALAVWPLLAVVPVLLGSSLGREPEVDDLDVVDEPDRPADRTPAPFAEPQDTP